MFQKHCPTAKLVGLKLFIYWMMSLCCLTCRSAPLTVNRKFPMMAQCATCCGQIQKVCFLFYLYNLSVHVSCYHSAKKWVIFLFKNNNWRSLFKTGLSDNFGPPLASQNCKIIYFPAMLRTVTKGIVLCRKCIVLVIWIEFPLKHYQLTLLLTRKEKFLKC